MNRRRFIRQPIALSALVHPTQGRSWLCGIRDFCQQGMLLTGSGSTRSLTAVGADPKRGDPLAVHFSVPSPSGPQHFRVQAQIARLLENGQGVGVMFEAGLPAAAFEALLEYASASGLVAAAPDAAGGAGDATAADGSEAAARPDAGSVAATGGKTASGMLDPQFETELGIPLNLLNDNRLSESGIAAARKRIQVVLEGALRGMGQQFIDAAGREFLASARDAGNNAVHVLYLGALEHLERRGDIMIKDFMARVLAQFADVQPLEQVLERRRRRETGGQNDLGLVDREQFEDWLAVADIIGKAEIRHVDRLLEQRVRFGLIARSWAHREAIPVGPAVLSWAFADMLKAADLRREVHEDCYRYFDQVLLRNLTPLYDQLTETLEQSGLFPPASKLREALRRSGATKSIGRPRVGPVAYQGMESWVREAVMAAEGLRGAGGAPFDPYVARGVAEGGRAYGAARTLLELGAQRGGRRALPGHPLASGPVTSGGAEVYSQEEIQQALAELESEADAVAGARSGSGAGGRLRPRLEALLQRRFGQGKRLEPVDVENFSIMETLVDALESDSYLTEGAREWIRRLELTLNKLAARDRGFLERKPEEPQHSAVTLLNQLARLGSGGDLDESADPEVSRRVEALLARVIRDFDRNPQIFGDAVDELEPLLDKLARSYRGNVERTVRASEGKQKLARARRVVLQELRERLAGQEVPALVLELVNPGWRNLLVHTHLRRGSDSHEWRDQLMLLDQVLGQLTGALDPSAAGFVEPEALLKRIVQGLNSISFDPARRTPLIMALSAALVGDTAGERVPVQMQLVAAEGFAAALGFEGLEAELDSAPAGEDEEAHASWAAAVARTRRIDVGEWLATVDPEGRPLILSVAFLGDDFASFVLVNRKGLKVREYTFAEMVAGLREGRITPLDDFDLPLVQRASQRMLERLHSRLAFQAAHDELTTLLNRREFERLVGRAIQSARTRNETHALLYIDLDQFKLVNNTSGHTAGDHLLKHVAVLLADALGSERAQLARLGGDEYGILVEQCLPEHGRELARMVLQRIRDSQFEWEGRSYANLSASIGLVLIDQTTESVDLAMQYADEACYAAKDAGRNRIQEYQHTDVALKNRHGIMEWVERLDKALTEDRLVLNCQEIAPLDPARAHLTHYEILLTMADESGRIMPPADFILAAETYQRMAAVDRWVIERVLRWMALNQDRLDDFGGFAINVSGHSINDESFPDFVLDQFVHTQAPTGKVCFEITETAAIGNLENAREFMNRMRIIGCRFALDDFGTGLSSYSYLRNLPVDYVKIDGVFIKALANDLDDYAVVRSINEIAHYLGKQTIAECVETRGAFESVRDMGVDFAQGFFIGKPLPLDELRLPH